MVSSSAMLSSQRTPLDASLETGVASSPVPTFFIYSLSKNIIFKCIFCFYVSAKFALIVIRSAAIFLFSIIVYSIFFFVLPKTPSVLIVILATLWLEARCLLSAA